MTTGKHCFHLSDQSGEVPKSTFPERQLMCHGIAACFVFSLGSLWMGDAQAAAVCSNTPGDGDWIACEKASTSNDDIEIDVDGVAISTTAASTPGIKAEHAGGTSTDSGDITIDVTGTSTNNTISTTGNTAEGIFGKHTGFGDVDVDLEDITITTTGGAPSLTTGSAMGVRVEHTGTGDVDFDATAVSISTTGGADAINSEGVFAKHSGDGDIDIAIEGKTTGTTTTPTTITTTSLLSHGIFARQFTTPVDSGTPVATSGDIAITLEDTEINTSGESALGIYALIDHKNCGSLTATLNSGVTITSRGVGGVGVWLSNENDTKNAVDSSNNPLSYDVTIAAQGITVRTNGAGLHGRRINGDGDLTINVDGSTITTEGDDSQGIKGVRQGDESDGSITISATNGSVTTGGNSATEGVWSFGIHAEDQYVNAARRSGAGDIRITTRDFDITTTSTAPRSATNPGNYSYGIYARQFNAGNIIIDLQEGSSITTEGHSSHGVYALHYGTADTRSKGTRSIDITAGGPITTRGVGALGVRVGSIGSAGPRRIAELGADGYRQQTVTVNSRISSRSAGIYLVNGGKVIIGPQGSIRSGRGIAILATGTVPEVPEDATDPLNVIPAVPAIPPKLRVDLNLGGRRVYEALGDNWILNDGGETTIAVNGVVLHDGATGVTDNTAQNGAYNVSMLAGGVNVTDRTNSDHTRWVVSDRAEDVIAGRDFCATDFSEGDRCGRPPPQRPRPPPPPPPPPEPDPPAVDGAKLGELVGGVVADALGSILSTVLGEQEVPASPSSSPFIEEYAPRAAVYEALPAALLSLNDAGQGMESPSPQGTFTFARTLEDHSGLRPANSTVGQHHALGYGGAQFGRRLQLGETLRASVALHRVWSTVDVEASTGGGEIGVEATGLVLNGAWDGPEGFYAKAGLSMTHYRLGTWSEDRAVGMLAGGVGARGSLARIEAGREVSLGGGLHVAPHIWFKRSALSVDGFTDAVGSRVSIPGTARMTGGVGMAARAERRAGSGMLSLRGSADLVHVLDGRAAATEVSGARLTSQAEETELRLALSGVYRQGRFSLAAEASLNGSDPGDARGAVGLRLSASF